MASYGFPGGLLGGSILPPTSVNATTAILPNLAIAGSNTYSFYTQSSFITGAQTPPGYGSMAFTNPSYGFGGLLLKRGNFGNGAQYPPGGSDFLMNVCFNENQTILCIPGGSTGYVGIGTTNPQTGLHCYNSTNFSLLLDNGTNSSLFQQAAGSGGLYIRTGTGTGGGTNGLYINSGGTLIGPNADNFTNLGGGSNRFVFVYAVNGTIQTSDARQKTNVIASNLGLNFIKNLNPVSYTWKVGQKYIDAEGNITTRPGKRTFYGFLAQEVKKTLDDLGTGDFSGWILTDVNDPDSEQGLRYTDFIAPMVKSIQELSAQNAALEQSLATATANFSSLEARIAALESK